MSPPPPPPELPGVEQAWVAAHDWGGLAGSILALRKPRARGRLRRLQHGRIVTHPSVLPRPLAPKDAIDRGNDVPDGHPAALMRQHGVRTIYTRDRDFRRFDGIAAEDPFSDRR